MYSFSQKTINVAEIFQEVLGFGVGLATGASLCQNGQNIHCVFKNRTSDTVSINSNNFG